MFKLISDGGCDFSKEETLAYDISIAPFYITFDGETYLKEGIDISKDEYYQRLRNEKNLFPKTAQPNPQDYCDLYREFLEKGQDIVSLTISSKLSGTYNSATLAAQMMSEEFPDRKIIVIDSLNVAIGQGLILRELIKMRELGYTIDKAAALALKIVKTTKIYFTLDSLEYLKRGGRVGPTTALVGGILGLRPILHLVDGSVEQLDSVRGKGRVLKLIEEGIVAALSGEQDNINLSVAHILSEDEAIDLKKMLETSLNMKIINPVNEIGATVGTHAGPGALAIAYCKKFECFLNEEEAV